MTRPRKLPARITASAAPMAWSGLTARLGTYPTHIIPLDPRRPFLLSRSFGLARLFPRKAAR